MRLLLAENDQSRGSAMHAALGRAGYAIDWVQTSVHMQGALTTHRYDCAVLDLPMPDVARDILLPHLRQQQPHLPVIVVTAGTIEDRVALLDQGADDCLVRPFHLDELTARIRSLMRRTKHVGEEEDALMHGSIKLDPQRNCATWAQRDVRLTHCEFSVLEALVRKKNQIVSRAQLEESLYGWGDEVNSNAIEVYIHYLRRKFYPGLIVTVRGLGYQLASEPT
jgi:DNA-binding response OmpR family regulator